MKKIIPIGGTDYNMNSSALTQFKYKDMTGRKLMQDIKTLTKIKSNKEGIEYLDDLDDMIEIVLPIAYTMIVEADPKQVGSFDDFLKNTETLFDDTNWFNDVIELAVAPISGGNKATPQSITK